MTPKTGKVLRLQDVCGKPIQYGIVQAGPDVEGGIPYVRVVDIEDGQVSLQGLLRTTEDISSAYARTALEASDLLFVLRGDIGQVASVPDELRGANISRGLARLCPRKSIVLSEYLKWALMAPKTREELRRKVNGSALQEVSIGQLRTLPVYIPPLEEQSRIASVLDRWRQTERIQRRLLELKKKRRSALARCLATGDLRQPGRPPGPRRATRYGNIPADWEYVPIGSIARQVSERGGQALHLPVLSCTKSRGLVESATYFGRRVHSEDVSDYKVVRRGNFAYATNHIEEGSIGLQQDINAGLVSPMYTVFAITSESVRSSFLYLLLKTEMYRHTFGANTNASVDRRGGLRWDDFARIHVPVPPLEEQEYIVYAMSVCDKEIELQERVIATTAAQRSGLLRHLLGSSQLLTTTRRPSESCE